MWGDNHKALIGKSIKDIEQSYSGQEELHSAKKRNLILGASLGVLLIIFGLVTFLGNQPPPQTAVMTPNNTRALVTPDPEDLFTNEQDRLFGDLTGADPEQTGSELTGELLDGENGAPFDVTTEAAAGEETAGEEAAGAEAAGAATAGEVTPAVTEPPPASAVEETPAVTPTPPPVAAPIPPGEVETISHLVRYGDNFASISGLYYNTEAYAEALAAFNNLSMNEMLYIGSYLRIPVDPSQM